MTGMTIFGYAKCRSIGTTFLHAVISGVASEGCGAMVTGHAPLLEDEISDLHRGQHGDWTTHSLRQLKG